MTDKPVKVPTVVVDPAVDSEGLAEAMKTIAEPAVSGPVTLAVGDKKVSLPVTAYTPALVVHVEDNELKPYIDPKKLAEPLTDSVTGIGKKAVDATVRIENGKPVVVPGKEGVGLQPEEMAQKLLPVHRQDRRRAQGLDHGQGRRPAVHDRGRQGAQDHRAHQQLHDAVPVRRVPQHQPGSCRSAAQRNDRQAGRDVQLQQDRRRADCRQRLHDRHRDQRRRVPRGARRRRLPGRHDDCTTPAFFGGMDDVEHHPHAFYINRYPVGREATVYYGSLDLRWKNSTKYGVLIRAWVNKSTPSSAGQMHVELWSTKVYDIKAGQSARRNFRSPGKQYDDTDRCVPQGPIQGFDIDIYRTFYQGGKKVKSETDTARYQAADTRHLRQEARLTQRAHSLDVELVEASFRQAQGPKQHPTLSWTAGRPTSTGRLTGDGGDHSDGCRGSAVVVVVDESVRLVEREGGLVRPHRLQVRLVGTVLDRPRQRGVDDARSRGPGVAPRGRPRRRRCRPTRR